MTFLGRPVDPLFVPTCNSKSSHQMLYVGTANIHDSSSSQQIRWELFNVSAFEMDVFIVRTKPNELKILFCRPYFLDKIKIAIWNDKTMHCQSCFASKKTKSESSNWQIRVQPLSKLIAFRKQPFLMEKGVPNNSLHTLVLSLEQCGY